MLNDLDLARLKRAEKDLGIVMKDSSGTLKESPQLKLHLSTARLEVLGALSVLESGKVGGR